MGLIQTVHQIQRCPLVSRTVDAFQKCYLNNRFRRSITVISDYRVRRLHVPSINKMMKSKENE